MSADAAADASAAGDAPRAACREAAAGRADRAPAPAARDRRRADRPLIATAPDWRRRHPGRHLQDRQQGRGPGRRAGDREAAIDAETVRVVARRGPTRIVETRHGLVMAAAGVDASNTAPGTVLLLPEDPDASARRLRAALAARRGRHRRRRRHRHVRPAVAQRPDRHRDRRRRAGAAARPRGQADTYGNLLEVTVAAVADEIAAAADLVKGKTTPVPVAVVRGLPRAGHRPARTGRARRPLVRPAEEDMFRLGARADVLAAAADGAGVHRRAGRPGGGAAGRRRGGDRARPRTTATPWRFVVLESAAGPDRAARRDARGAGQADLRGDGFTEEQIARRVRRGDVAAPGAADLVVPCLVADGRARLPRPAPERRRAGDVPRRHGRRACRTCWSRWPSRAWARAGCPARCSAATWSRRGAGPAARAGSRWAPSASATRPPRRGRGPTATRTASR